MSPDDFFKEYSQDAINEQIRSGIPASIILAQAAIESGYGQSLLTIQANNFFGIKQGNNWNGETAVFSTQNDSTATSVFRKYATPRDSFKDHTDFLNSNKRYVSCFGNTDYIAWANCLEHAGYSETAGYGQSLINLIQKYNLQEYDKKAVQKKIIIYGLIVILIIILFVIGYKIFSR